MLMNNSWRAGLLLIPFPWQRSFGGVGSRRLSPSNRDGPGILPAPYPGHASASHLSPWSPRPSSSRAAASLRSLSLADLRKHRSSGASAGSGPSALLMAQVICVQPPLPQPFKRIPRRRRRPLSSRPLCVRQSGDAAKALRMAIGCKVQVDLTPSCQEWSCPLNGGNPKVPDTGRETKSGRTAMGSLPPLRGPGLGASGPASAAPLSSPVRSDTGRPSTQQVPQ